MIDVQVNEEEKKKKKNSKIYFEFFRILPQIYRCLQMFTNKILGLLFSRSNYCTLTREKKNRK